MSSTGHAEVIPLWPNGAPGSEQWTQREIELLLFPGERVLSLVAASRDATRDRLTGEFVEA